MVGPYMKMELIGEGSFGEVWSAQSVSPPSVLRDAKVEIVVVKIPKRTRPDSAPSLDIEAQILRKLNHPRIIRIRDFVPGVYLTMDHAAGNVAELILRGTLSIGQIARFLYGILEGLEYIHIKGFLHLDLK